MRGRSRSREPDQSYGSGGSGGANNATKKSKKGRRRLMKRANSGDSNVSYRSTDDSYAANPNNRYSNHTNYQAPPAWNQPAYQASSTMNMMADNSSKTLSKKGSRGRKIKLQKGDSHNSRSKSNNKKGYYPSDDEYEGYSSRDDSYAPGSPTQKKKKRLFRRKKRDESVSSRNTTGSRSLFGRFRKNSDDGGYASSDNDYQNKTNRRNKKNQQYNSKHTPRSQGIPQQLSFGKDSPDNDSDMYDFDPSQSHPGNDMSEYGYSDRDPSETNSYTVPVTDDSETGYNSKNDKYRKKKSRKKGRDTSGRDVDRSHRSTSSRNPDWRHNESESLDTFDRSHKSFEDSGSQSDFYSEGDWSSEGESGEFSLNISGNTHEAPPDSVDYTQKNRHSKDLASQNLQAIESMARKAGENRADEAFQVMPDHSYPNTKMTRKQLRKNMNARSAYYHDLRIPQLKSNKFKELGRLRVEIMQCFGLPTTSQVREVSAYAVCVMGSAAFQTDVIPTVANPMWLSKMRRACLFSVPTMYSQLSIGIFDLEAAYADPVVGFDSPAQRGFMNRNRSNAEMGGRKGSMGMGRKGSMDMRGNPKRSSSISHRDSMGSRRGSAHDSMEFLGAPVDRRSSSNLTYGSANFDDDDRLNGLPHPLKQPAPFSTNAEDFIGHVVVDICRLRPGSTYDVTLPLRRSKHVFSREPLGSVRVRLHLEWVYERGAVMSYLPKSLGGSVLWQKQPNTRYVVNCVDDRATRNVAHAVHGIHMPGKFDVTLLQSTIREIHWTRIHLFRYCKNREIYNLTYWKYPSISGFVFCAWMHALYFNTVSFVPGHIVVFLLLHLLKNYAYYSMDSPLQNGFLPPSLEELYWALVSGTRKRKKPCIEPLTVEREADPMALTNSDHERLDKISGSARSNGMDELYDENGNIVHVSRVPLSEIAENMKKSLKVKPYRKGMTYFKHTFQGDDAVDFMLSMGYAMTRPEAVTVGRRLEREKKLFQHVKKDANFEDSPFLYYFLDIETDKFLSQSTHTPAGTMILEMLGFYSRKGRQTSGKNKKGKNTKNSAGVDILEAREHVEFPFATGMDHPRFTVKESLVIRSGEEKTRLKREDEAKTITEMAQFGIIPAPRPQFVRPTPVSGYESEPGMGSNYRGASQRNIIAGLTDNVVTRTARRGSMVVGGAIVTGATAVAAGATAMTESIRSGGRGIEKRISGTSSVGSGGLLLEKLGSQKNIFAHLKEQHQNNKTLNKVLDLQVKADEYDPYEYDSDNDVKTILKKKRKKHVILEKHLKKPMSQEIGTLGITEVDMSLAKSLKRTKRHVDGSFYYMFDNQVYKVDKNVFPTKLDKNKNTEVKKKKKRGLFNRKQAIEDEKKEEEERLKRMQMTPYEQQLEDLDKTLLINEFSHWSPFINRIGVVIQPLLEIAQTGLFFFRALFNIFTWQDPVLCFWICFVGVPLALFLYICPFRFLSFFLCIYSIGPQNYVIRIFRESKEGYEPPNFDMIVKTKKIEKVDDFEEMQFFSSEAPGNQQVRFRNIDPAQVKQIVVPSNVLRYGSRFYDWPPEPKYARVYASEAPTNLVVPGFAEDASESQYDGYTTDSSIYTFDQAARKKDMEEREKIQRKKRKKKQQGFGNKILSGLTKTTQMGIGVVETAGDAVLMGGEELIGHTARFSVAAVKGTGQITKTVVKGTGTVGKSAIKGTGNLLRLRKKNKDKSRYQIYDYEDEEDGAYYGYD